MCVWATLVRLVERVDLRPHNVALEFGAVAPGMYRRPFVIDFSAWLRSLSHAVVDIDAYNAFTLGDFSALDGRPRCCRYSNFLAPRGRFKDSWFGVYIVLDDSAGRGRRFALTEPGGDPAALDNLNPFALKRLPELDQKLVVFSTHDRHPGYTLEQFEREFSFTLKPGTSLQIAHVHDRQQRCWLQVDGTYATLAAVPDLAVCRPRIFKSIRVYTGLPDAGVYQDVAGWHPVELRGRCWVRYFGSPHGSFWALVYSNGSAFTRRDGVAVDTWQQFELGACFDAMFAALRIDTLRP